VDDEQQRRADHPDGAPSVAIKVGIFDRPLERIVKDLLRQLKRYAVLRPVAGVFGVIPRPLLYFCNYIFVIRQQLMICPCGLLDSGFRPSLTCCATKKKARF
jgi:hypothetical protein